MSLVGIFEPAEPQAQHGSVLHSSYQSIIDAQLTVPDGVDELIRINL